MIGLEQPAAAERYFDRIEDKARLLKSQPRMGVRSSDIRPSMRMLVDAPYRKCMEHEPQARQRSLTRDVALRILAIRELEPKQNFTISLHCQAARCAGAATR